MEACHSYDLFVIWKAFKLFDYETDTVKGE